MKFSIRSCRFPQLEVETSLLLSGPSAVCLCAKAGLVVLGGAMTRDGEEFMLTRET